MIRYDNRNLSAHPYVKKSPSLAVTAGQCSCEELKIGLIIIFQLCTSLPFPTELCNRCTLKHIILYKWLREFHSPRSSNLPLLRTSEYVVKREPLHPPLTKEPHSARLFLPFLTTFFRSVEFRVTYLLLGDEKSGTKGGLRFGTETDCCKLDADDIRSRSSEKSYR